MEPTTLLPTPSPEQILVVDDHPANLRLLSQLLQDRGYQLRAVTSGARALASVEMAPPDLLLLDIRMPEMDGYEVCRRLKANPKTRDIPIIFISALDEIQDKVRAFEVGGVDYITKPFQLEEVTARVETHLSLRRLQQSLQDANRRMARELDLAAQVQASFLSKALPDLPGWQLAVSLIPAKTTSGDFFDVMRLPDGSIGILIADVVDKGVGAALFMAMSSTLLRTYMMEYPGQPEQVFHHVNRSILEYTSAEQFVTVFLGMLDPLSGRLVYTNAGQNPPLWISVLQDDPPQLLTRTGPPLGVVPEAAWQRRGLALSPRDMLVLYTDGVTEAENVDGEFFDMARLVRASRDGQGRTAVVARDAILDAVHRFTGGAPQSDDIALVVLLRE